MFYITKSQNIALFCCHGAPPVSSTPSRILTCSRYRDGETLSRTETIQTIIFFFIKLYSELSRSLAYMSESRTIRSIWYYQHSAARFRPRESQNTRPEFFFVTYFERNEVSSSSCEDPKTAVDGWGARQLRKYTPKKCWNIWTSWWRHFSQTLWVSQCKRHGPNVYFSLNTLQPFHTGIVLITSYSLSSMTNICHVVFVHSLSAHGWRSLLHWYVHCFGKVFILFHT